MQPFCGETIRHRPVVMVCDGMLPGEQERAKTIINGEEDWIIWRVKTTKGEHGEQSGDSGNCQVTTDFLEQFDMRLEGIQTKGQKAQRTSESRSRGGFTRRRGWYHTNDIRTVTCHRDMEIWIPKIGRGYCGRTWKRCGTRDGTMSRKTSAGYSWKDQRKSGGKARNWVFCESISSPVTLQLQMSR